MKLVTVVGTRPELIRLSRVISRLDAESGIDQILVHTGQNYDYELNQVFFEDLGIRKPDIFLETDRSTLGSLYGTVLIETESLLISEDPDALLVLGDTNSAISALMARRRKVPIFHMEAGNRSFDLNVPEETNRRVVDHVSDFNLVYTEHARRNLLIEGIHPRGIYLTGSPLFEVIHHFKKQIDDSGILDELGLKPSEFYLVSLHREENVDFPDRLRALLSGLRSLAERTRLPIIVSTHPRTWNRLEHLGTDGLPSEIRLLKPFGFFDYMRLQVGSRCVISDSGSISEESAILGFPAVTPRDSIERPEALDHGTVILCGTEPERLLEAIKAAEKGNRPALEGPLPNEYQVPNVSERVARLILGLAHLSHGWSGIRSMPTFR